MRHDPNLKAATAIGARPFPPPPGTVRTLADLRAVVPDLGYSPRVTQLVLGAIDHAPRAYGGSPLERIHVSHGAFVERWGQGRVGAIPAGFPNERHFVDWRKRIRMALSRAEGGPVAPTALLPDWATLLAFCKDNQGGHARRVPPHLDKSVGALGARASARGLGPAALTDGVVEMLFAGAKGKERRTLRCGLDSLNTLIRGRRALPEVASLLPLTPLARPAPAKAAAARLRRGQPGSEQLWRKVDMFLEHKRENGEVRGALQHVARPKVGNATLRV
jgi:hypothetical protein